MTKPCCLINRQKHQRLSNASPSYAGNNNSKEDYIKLAQLFLYIQSYCCCCDGDNISSKDLMFENIFRFPDPIVLQGSMIYYLLNRHTISLCIILYYMILWCFWFFDGKIKQDQYKTLNVYTLWYSELEMNVLCSGDRRTILNKEFVLVPHIKGFCCASRVLYRRGIYTLSNNNLNE